MATYHIHIKGIVQGVGFRPFVYRLAQEFGLSGWVSNTLSGVHIEVSGKVEIINDFYRACLTRCPQQARITEHSLTPLEEKFFSDFRIEESDTSNAPELVLTPDFGLCGECLAELNEPENIRHTYAFITCTHCGPRYSILTGLPYDRPQTSMDDFEMCPACTQEYHDVNDRRYYSQTNSCPSCGVELALFSAETQIPGKAELLLSQVQDALANGKIIAVKGIGGYLLLCDATEEQAILSLRRRKHRAHKPFALLYPDLNAAQKDVLITQTEVQALQGLEAPILLLPLKASPSSGICQEAIAPGLDQLGVMLPYAPLLALISQRFGKALVATSANLSGSPIVFTDDLALSSLFAYADLILTHNRAITSAQDDSVVKYTSKTQQRILLRRSRGFAPNYFDPEWRPKSPILAMGAEMKGSICLANEKNLYVSQYLGALQGYESQQNYQHTLLHLKALLQFRPEKILADLHPSYYATQAAHAYAADQALPIHSIQHHEAHFAAILGEHHLLAQEESVLGCIWDGTGYGHDQQIWGGECFSYTNRSFERTHHLAYYPVLAGDKMAKEPRLSALSLLGPHPLLRDKFSQAEWNFYQKAIEKPSLMSSSMGRVFDAVACLTGLADRMSFEAQAAMKLEACALAYFQQHQWQPMSAYPFEIRGKEIKLQLLFQALIEDLRQGKTPGFIAARFHQSLVHLIQQLADLAGGKKLAFSGGVFQNATLVDLIRLQLGDRYTLYFHQQLPPNDENISFGQVMHYLIHQYQPSSVSPNTQTTIRLCV